MKSRCHESCLRLAMENQCRSVAFPSISTGVYRFPLGQASKIAVRTILEFLKTHPDMEVRMVCFDRETFEYYERALQEQFRESMDTLKDSSKTEGQEKLCQD